MLVVRSVVSQPQLQREQGGDQTRARAGMSGRRSEFLALLDHVRTDRCEYTQLGKDGVQ